ncbi:MAG: CvpA family protein [Clostridia bacterium]|nr:CvpA family protein [Clostridia bacterium]
MSIVLSIVLVLIVAVFTLIGVKKGFFATVAGFIAPLASLVLTILFYKPVAAFLKSTLFAKMVTDVELPNIEGDVFTQLAGLMEYLNKTDLGELAEAIKNNVMAEILSIAIAIVGLFVVLFIVLKIVFKLLNLVATFPVLKQANGLLGGVIGLCEGFVWCWVFALVFGSFIFPALNASNPELFTTDMLTSPVYQLCTKFNPIGLILSLIQLITGA